MLGAELSAENRRIGYNKCVFAPELKWEDTACTARDEHVL